MNNKYYSQQGLTTTSILIWIVGALITLGLGLSTVVFSPKPDAKPQPEVAQVQHKRPMRVILQLGRGDTATSPYVRQGKESK